MEAAKVFRGRAHTSPASGPAPNRGSGLKEDEQVSAEGTMINPTDEIHEENYEDGDEDVPGASGAGLSRNAL